ncbi:MAG: biotin--[acetyl-CoA-carboxylase] ligase [Spirochaetaceae bacterium]|nr:biotin--[acetyl-CoA-carboxylase] ligase [Spirochaetaceae bacterium]
MKKIIDVENPWGAPLHHIESCDSTMEEARLLEKDNAPTGSLVIADFQRCGRGRIKQRVWEGKNGESLLCTILLRYHNFDEFPEAITLRCGLAIVKALESVNAHLAPGHVQPVISIKWPNDVMVNNKKISGILTESDGKNIFIGIGINILQNSFRDYPGATSIMMEWGNNGEAPANIRPVLLEEILKALYYELNDEKARCSWRSRLDQKLFMKNKDVLFIEGQADSGRKIQGKLCGLSEQGGLLIVPENADIPCECITGELQYPK